jgi:hypothetical protein
MLEPVAFNHLSVEGLFWAKITHNQIGFGLNNLPENVHFTIAFNASSPDINLHVTKNTRNESKPKVEIFRIDKKLLEELALGITKRLMFSLLEPFDVANLIGTEYISFTKAEQSDAHPEVERLVKERFKSITKIKQKTRVKVGSIEEAFPDFPESEKIIGYFNNSTYALPEKPTLSAEVGMLMGEQQVLIIGLEGKWYKYKTDLQIRELLTGVFGEELSKQLILRTKKAIVRVRNAESYLDTQVHDNHFRLVKRTENGL